MNLLLTLSTNAGSDIAVHFHRGNGMKRIVFVSVTPTGKVVHGYAMRNTISEGDFVLQLAWQSSF